MKTKYTKVALKEITKSSLSVAQVLRKLGLKEAGGSHTYISGLLKRFEINTDHFLGQSASLGKESKKKKHWKDILIKREKGKRVKAHILRRALIESGREYKCEVCSMEPIWNGKELRFQVDHKNGDWLDDRKENVQFCCPNCHTQTPGYNGSKGYSDVVKYRDPHSKKRTEALKQKRLCKSFRPSV